MRQDSVCVSTKYKKSYYSYSEKLKQTDSKNGLIWTVDNGKSLGFEGQLATLRRILNINHITTGFDGYQLCVSDNGRCGRPISLNKKPKDENLKSGGAVYVKLIKPPPIPPQSPPVATYAASSSYSDVSSRSSSLRKKPSSVSFSAGRLRQLNQYAGKLNRFSDEDLKVIFGDKALKGRCPTCGINSGAHTHCSSSYGDLREVSTVYEPTERSTKSGRRVSDRKPQKIKPTRDSPKYRQTSKRDTSRHWVREWDKLMNDLETDNLMQRLPNSTLARAWAVHDDNAALYDSIPELHDIHPPAAQEDIREYIYDVDI